jgi:hypothetical protein
MKDGWLTAADLDAAGYKRHDKPPQGYGDALYQKCIRLDGAKLYYINMCMYDFRGDHPPRDEYQVRFEPRGQFKLPDGAYFNVTLLLHKGHDVAYVEDFFARVFWGLGCLPYEGDVGPLTRVAKCAGARTDVKSD